MVQEAAQPISDPLLRPDRAPRDFTGAPVRAPLGNSIKTLLLFGLLVVIGVAVWWVRRPADLTERLGAREWAIVEVDGEPAVNEIGTASTFVLDGTGEIRAASGCNVASGSWRFDSQGQRLAIDWQTQTEQVCPDGFPHTYRPTSGRVRLDGADLRVESDMVEVRAVSLSDRDPASMEQVHGEWLSGSALVEIGERGLFAVGSCRGTWVPNGDDPTSFVIEFDDSQIDRAGCELDPLWDDDEPVVVVQVDRTVFLRRDRATFPLDRSIIRLDLATDVPGTHPLTP